MPAKGFASHGESWSIALGLRLASLEVLRADGDDPVLILDDVFAELDAPRRRRLTERVAGCTQVLLTAAVGGRRAGRARRPAPPGHAGSRCPMPDDAGPDARAASPAEPAPDDRPPPTPRPRPCAGRPGRRRRAPKRREHRGAPDRSTPTPAIRSRSPRRSSGWSRSRAGRTSPPWPCSWASGTQIVGRDIAEHVRPVSFADGELSLEAESTAWATQVRLLLPQVHRAVDERVGTGVVAGHPHQGAAGAHLDRRTASGEGSRTARHVRLDGP